MTRSTKLLNLSTSTWLVTGGGGFIGSHIVETLLSHGQFVRVLDNFSTGYQHNLDAALAGAGQNAGARLRVIHGDVTDADTCVKAAEGADYALHLAALGSVPLSMEQPEQNHAINVSGMLNLLQAARSAGIRRLVYSSSSAVYGNQPGLPKIETMSPAPLSPYAASKWIDEIYASIWWQCYQVETVGLRYFNVFGPRQDPAGAYAAVIPAWVDAMIHGRPVTINGDGLQTRDFCYVGNISEANILAALGDHPNLPGAVCNVATGGTTTLLELFTTLRDALLAKRPDAVVPEPVHGPPRTGDVIHSQADITRAADWLGYRPAVDLDQGLRLSMDYYLSNC